MVAKFLLVVALVTGAVLCDSCEKDENLKQWEKFKVDYNKNYDTKDEEELRKGIFMERLKFIQSHHKKYKRGDVTYDVGINQFSDLSHEEFISMYGMSGGVAAAPKMGSATEGRSEVKCYSNERADVPDSIDWRERGVVSEVKIQGGRCGACWAFSAVACLESRVFLKTKKMIPLSVQNLIDCSREEGNQGCSSGDPIAGFFFVKRNRGLASESEYPYIQRDSRCRNVTKSPGTKIRGIVRVTPRGNEEKLKIAVATTGPISVNIQGNATGFEEYRQGVYYNPSCSARYINHSVLLVGYGRSREGDYWLVKNSWGPNWGEDGYFRLARNRGNMCGIASSAVYPTFFD